MREMTFPSLTRIWGQRRRVFRLSETTIADAWVTNDPVDEDEAEQIEVYLETIQRGRHGESQNYHYYDEDGQLWTGVDGSETINFEAYWDEFVERPESYLVKARL